MIIVKESDQQADIAWRTAKTYPELEITLVQQNEFLLEKE